MAFGLHWATRKRRWMGPSDWIDDPQSKAAGDARDAGPESLARFVCAMAAPGTRIITLGTSTVLPGVVTFMSRATRVPISLM